jgi:glycosyltransferase 2 family protein
MKLVPRELKPAALELAPGLAALGAFAAGVMLLVSSATPVDPDRFHLIARLFPRLVIHASDFLSSVIGLLLVLLAFGLSRRVNAAWGATIALVAVAAVLAIVKGFEWEETTALSLIGLLLLPLGGAFYRNARLTRIELSPGWLLSAGALALGAAVVAFWSFPSLRDYDDLWWRVLGDTDASRALRSVTGAALLVMAVGVWRLFSTTSTPAVIGEDDCDFHRVRAILAKAEEAEPDAKLALLGDKRFLFSDSGESFLMFGVRNRSWVALGPPVGKVSERAELLWRLRELADAHAARAAFYNIGPDLLPEVVELGFAIQKIGETGLVPLEHFTLEGRRRGNVRRSWRKIAEAGAQFEVAPPEALGALMAELRRVSDGWLKGHAGGDKAFSMGGFTERYVGEFPTAVVRLEGRVVAFATLWTTPDESLFSIDLMRYDPDAPKDVMDYLFIELLLWGQASGYAAFSLGMAPLAGLQDRRLAPLISRVGKLVFERGEEFYNFQGVRRFKDKYDPAWEPRYAAAPHRWQIPFVLADVGLLSSGGLAGIARRGRSAPGAGPEPHKPRGVREGQDGGQAQRQHQEPPRREPRAA